MAESLMILGISVDHDLWWVFVAAVVAGLGGLFVIGMRFGVTITIRKARAGFLGWFRDAVDEHVEPKFQELRDETLAIADTLAHRTFATAADVKREVEHTADVVRAELLEHTENEEGLIRDTVSDVLAPLAKKVEGHIVADAAAFQRNDNANEATAKRQVELLRRLALLDGPSEQQQADLAESRANLKTLVELTAKLTQYADELADRAPDESE